MWSSNRTIPPFDACRGEKEIREIQNILHDINSIKSSFNLCGFTSVKWTGNKVAHQIAALGKSNMLHGNWTMYPPESLRKLILEDASMVGSGSLKKKSQLGFSIVKLA